MNNDDKYELNELRKHKQADLCEKIESSVTLTGEDLSKTSELIDELKELQLKRIKYFREVMDNE